MSLESKLHGVDELLEDCLFELRCLQRGAKLLRDNIEHAEFILAENDAAATRFSADLALCIRRLSKQIHLYNQPPDAPSTPTAPHSWSEDTFSTDKKVTDGDQTPTKAATVTSAEFDKHVTEFVDGEETK